MYLQYVQLKLEKIFSRTNTVKNYEVFVGKIINKHMNKLLEDQTIIKEKISQKLFSMLMSAISQQ